MKLNYRDYAWSVIAGDNYLFNAESGTYYYVNVVGMKIWNMIQIMNDENEEEVFRKISERLVSDYNSDYDSIYEDVKDFINQMKRINAVY